MTENKLEGLRLLLMLLFIGALVSGIVILHIKVEAGMERLADVFAHITNAANL